MAMWEQSNIGLGESSVGLKEQSALSELTAGDIMQCGAVTISYDSSVYSAIGILAENHYSGLPVVNHGELVGIISEKDVLKVLYESDHLTGTVADYMTRDVVSYDIQDSLEAIGTSLVSNNFRRVAIVMEGKLCGVISRSDLIRHFVKVRNQAIARDSDSSQSRLALAKDIMKTGLLTVTQQTSIDDAADILSANQVTGLPVVDDGMFLQGIVSEKDILRVLFDAETTGNQVQDIMTSDVVTFSYTDSVYDICDCLINNEFRRVPILNQGRLVGIVSRSDIVMHILKNKSSLNRSRIKH